jgi:hypothetical protein
MNSSVRIFDCEIRICPRGAALGPILGAVTQPRAGSRAVAELEGFEPKNPPVTRLAELTMGATCRRGYRVGRAPGVSSSKEEASDVTESGPHRAPASQEPPA